MAINAVTSNPGIAAPGSSRGISDMKPEDFMKLLITQLQSQDPLKPTDNEAILQQMSMIRQMESSNELTSTLSSLTAQQKLGNTASLIGKYVIGTEDTAGGGTNPIQGVVVAVSYTSDGRALLELHNGQQLPADKIGSVTLVDNLPQGTVVSGATTAARVISAAKSKNPAAPPVPSWMKTLVKTARVA